MASAHGLAAPLAEFGVTFSSLTSLQRHRLCYFASCRTLSIKSCHGVSISVRNKYQNPVFLVSKPSSNRWFRLSKSVDLDHLLTSDDEGEMSEGFFEAIEELERMVRDPSDILEDLNDRLSARELRLVLVYFSQDGKDSWCVLEVFDWLRKENRVDKETVELMVDFMCGRVKKLIKEQHHVGDVVELLMDMECVGLRPGFSMTEKVISLYWDMGEKEGAVLFLEEVLRRRISYAKEDSEEHEGGLTGYLALLMNVSIC